MRVERQLSVFLENRVGVLARVARDLARHGIDIRGISVANLVDHALVRLVVNDPRKALHMLGERGVLVVTSPVLSVDVLDQAGSLAAIARRLGRAGVNIEYAYGSCSPDGRTSRVYLQVSDLRKSRAALSGLRLPRRRP